MVHRTEMDMRLLEFRSFFLPDFKVSVSKMEAKPVSRILKDECCTSRGGTEVCILLVASGMWVAGRVLSRVRDGISRVL